MCRNNLEFQRGIVSMLYKFLFEKTSDGAIENEIMSNKELAEELHQKIIRKVEKRKVLSSLINNILGADLVDMLLTSKLNKGFRFLLYVFDIYSKYACVIPLQDKIGIAITNALENILNESNCKLNKIWVDKGSEFYNR